MGYKSKNLSRSRNRAIAAKNDTNLELNKALGSLADFKRESEMLEKIKKVNNEFQSTVDTIGIYTKYYGQKRRNDLEDYNSWKNKFNTLVEEKGYEESSFPEFEDWRKNRTLANVGGRSMTYSDFNVEPIDIDKMNDILFLEGLKKNGK